MDPDNEHIQYRTIIAQAVPTECLFWQVWMDWEQIWAWLDSENVPDETGDLGGSSHFQTHPNIHKHRRICTAMIFNRCRGAAR